MDISTANRLIALRKKHGYSQEELASKLDISRQSISKWERSESSPDTDNLIALAKLYEISIDELLGLSNEEEDDSNIKESVVTFKYNPKKATRLVSNIFLLIAIVFYIAVISVYFILLRPENKAYKIATNENITKVPALVESYVLSNVYNNAGPLYKICYVVTTFEPDIYAQSNAVYALEEAKNLVGTTIYVRCENGKAVMVDYSRSNLSLAAYIIMGVFSAIATTFVFTSIIIKKIYSKQ